MRPEMKNGQKGTMTRQGLRKVYVYYTYMDRETKNLSPRERVKCTSNTGGRLLKYAVSRLYRLDAEELSRGKGEYGKPFFLFHPEIHFNISHSGSLVMCAVSDYEIGIDVQEKEQRNIDMVAEKILTPEEFANYLSAPDRRELFFRIWVMKEARLKWTGEGITRELRGMPMNGWHQFIHVDREYASCIWAQIPLDVLVKEVAYAGLISGAEELIPSRLTQ